MEWLTLLKKRTFSVWQQSIRDREPVPDDVIIVGAGIAGVSTAYWLKKQKPSARVRIIEAGHPGQGASGRNAGFLLQGSADDYESARDRYGVTIARTLWEFGRENQRLIRSELNAEAIELQTSGSWIAAGTEEEALRLERSAALLAADDLSGQYITGSEFCRKIQGESFFGALYTPGDAVVHPAKLVRHILSSAEIIATFGSPVVDVQPSSDGVDVITSERVYRARTVLLAMNAYLPSLFASTASCVRPVRAQMLATVPASYPKEFLHSPVYSHDGFYYSRRMLDGTLLVGGARHLHVDDELGYQDLTTEELQRDLEKYIRNHFPAAGGVAVARRWSGVMGFSPDHLPVFGTIPGRGRTWFVTGFSGHGMGFGFRMGKLIAEYFDTGDMHADLNTFEATRLEIQRTPR